MRHATRWFGLAVAALALVALPSDVQAQNEDIAATKHNFSLTSGRGVGGDTLNVASIVDYGEICVYCHTPHGATSDGPLWNRNGVAPTSYTLYNDATNLSQSDINMTFNATPGSVSLACLSCHEGSVGIDVVVNSPNAYTGPAADGTQTLASLAGANDIRVLGTDLRNDHPIAVQYSVAADAQFNPQGDAETAGLKFFGTNNTVECASCHNPHTTNATFLRIPNNSSNLCLTCHIK